MRLDSPSIGRHDAPLHLFLGGGSRCALVLLLLLAASADAQEATWKDIRTYRFALVRIPVWVTNHRGKARSNLDDRDFRLYVDGRPARIDHCLKMDTTPIEIVYLLDISGSMAVGGKLTASVETISYLVKHHRREDRWKIAVFGDGQILTVADHSDPEVWHERKRRLRAYGKTALFDVLSHGRELFEPDGHPSRAMLLFTDGNDNHSRISPEAFRRMLPTLEVPIFIVGIADGFIPNALKGREKLGIRTLQDITSLSGGRLMLAESSADLPKILSELQRALRPHYLLTMTVERGPEENSHDIRVEVRRRRSNLRYRRGYVGMPPATLGGTL